MTVLAMTTVLWLGALLAGFLGALTGLGGGVVIVPLLALGFGVDLRYAVGASLVSVIATSSGAAAAYVKEGYTNVRIGFFLEVATTLGALIGAYLSALVSKSVIGVLFGLVLMGSAYMSMRPRPHEEYAGPSGSLADKLKLPGSYPTADGLKHYNVRGVPGGFILMFTAGVLSALLGVGSGAIKVLAMDQVMNIPFKVSTTTSNFMIGVTAAASVGVYLARGYVDPTIATPVMLGVLMGSFLGARILAKAKVPTLRVVFAVVIFAVALEMIYKALTGGL